MTGAPIVFYFARPPTCSEIISTGSRCARHQRQHESQDRQHHGSSNQWAIPVIHRGAHVLAVRLALYDEFQFPQVIRPNGAVNQVHISLLRFSNRLITGMVFEHFGYTCSPARLRMFKSSKKLKGERYRCPKY
jgi:hypothetical protein